MGPARHGASPYRGSCACRVETAGGGHAVCSASPEPLLLLPAEMPSVTANRPFSSAKGLRGISAKASESVGFLSQGAVSHALRCSPPATEHDPDLMVAGLPSASKPAHGGHVRPAAT